MMRAINLTDYYKGLELGRDDVIRLADFIQDVLADEREYYFDKDCDSEVYLIEGISGRLESFMDDLKEGWNAH